MAFPLPPPMRLALDLAAAAARSGEVPVGAVVTRQGVVIATSANMMRGGSDPTAHAEIVVIRRAADSLGTSRLDDCDLWVTLEPCAMCAGAIALARIRRLYYAADDPKGGAVAHGPRLFGQPTCHHRPEIYAGIGADEAAGQLRRFFAERRPAHALSNPERLCEAAPMQDEQARAQAIEAAAAIGLDLPEETIAGVVVNRALLAGHLARVDAALAGIGGEAPRS